MVHKNKDSKISFKITEKYIISLLIFTYIIGICSGCNFIFNNPNNIKITNYIVINNTLNTAIYFILALLLKYSGVLNIALYSIPFFIGVQNSVSYSKIILEQNNQIIRQNFFTVIKDTAVLLLLILYIIVITSQILNKKYNIKNDIKYLFAYIAGTAVISVIYLIIINLIF